MPAGIAVNSMERTLTSSGFHKGMKIRSSVYGNVGIKNNPPAIKTNQDNN
jgi:hypothetical protein